MDYTIPTILATTAIILSWFVIPNTAKPIEKMGIVQTIFKNLKFYTKSSVALSCLLISATYGVLCSVTFALLGKRRLGQCATAKFYYALLSFVMGLKIKVERPELLTDLPAVLIANHQSEMDIYLLGKIVTPGCCVTAKKQLKYVPVLGWFMSAAGAFFLDRSDRQKSIDTLNKALDELKASKGGLFMFAEGTRSYSSTPTLLPLKKGAFHLAIQAQIPIIPMVSSNYSNIYSLKLKNFNTGTITLKVLDPIETKGLTKDDVSKLTAEVQKKMELAIMELGMSEVNGESHKTVQLTSTSGTSDATLNNRQPVESTSLLSDIN